MAILPEQAVLSPGSIIVHPEAEIAIVGDEAASTGSPWAAVAGKVVMNESADESKTVGDEVVAYFNSIEATNGENVNAEASHTLQSPPSISFQDAASLSISYIKASHILRHSLNINPPLQPNSHPSLANLTILILGGETHLAVALFQLLHTISPATYIIILVAITDQYTLFQRCSHLVQLGAGYALDGLTPDLMECLVAPNKTEPSGWDVVLDTTGALEQWPQLLKFVKGRKRVVDCQEVSYADAELKTGEVKLYERLLREAAEKFATVAELPSCGLADDDEGEG